MFAWLRDEPDALAIYVASEEDKLALIASSPLVYLTIPHYDGYATVLIRLEAIAADELAEMLTESWRLRAPKSLVRRFDAGLDSSMRHT